MCFCNTGMALLSIAADTADDFFRSAAISAVFSAISLIRGVCSFIDILALFIALISDVISAIFFCDTIAASFAISWECFADLALAISAFTLSTSNCIS